MTCKMQCISLSAALVMSASVFAQAVPFGGGGLPRKVAVPVVQQPSAVPFTGGTVARKVAQPTPTSPTYRSVVPSTGAEVPRKVAVPLVPQPSAVPFTGGTVARRSEQPRPTQTLVLASVQDIGPGCPGHNGCIPRLETDNLPTLGNPKFGYTITRCCPNTALTAVFSLGRIHAPRNKCTVWLDPGLWIGEVHAITSGSGDVRFGQPIPQLPQLEGLELFVQCAVLDVDGGFLGLCSLTNALKLVIGR
jgi:hypothetical protein